MSEGDEISFQQTREDNLSVIKVNVLYFIEFLAQDEEHITENGAELVFLTFSPSYVRCFYQMYLFFVERHVDFCKNNSHVKAGYQIGGLLVHNSKILHDPNVVECYFRRDAVWVCMTALLLIFLEEFNGREIIFDEVVFEKEMLQKLTNLVPDDWIQKIQTLNTNNETILRLGFRVPGYNNENFPIQ